MDLSQNATDKLVQPANRLVATADKELQKKHVSIKLYQLVGTENQLWIGDGLQ